MKNLLKYSIIIICIVASGYFLSNYVHNLDYVNNKTFEEAHKILNQKIDSLKSLTVQIQLNIDTIKTDVKQVKISVDSLKIGQELVYNQTQIIIKNQDKSFIPQSFLDYFKSRR